jgi:putative membrane-bound dehydrogenase-like protein
MDHRHPTRPRPGFAAWAALGAAAAALVAAVPAPARAQVSPEESARKLKPAEGLDASLWASEPMVHNPTNMDVDSRGRVWVTEGLNYRLHRAGNRRFHRIEEADRIKILEDTDGDGKADKMTVFADRIFPVPMGLAVEERYSTDGKYLGCKVYVGNSPDLLVLEDTDGDDKADKRYPLLTGFGGIDSDHGVHGMTLALDGKLYFTHGDGCCSVQQDHSERTQNFDVVDKSGRHVRSDQLGHTLRVNRDGTQFEALADRQRNDYEACLNSFGNVFISDNDDDGNRGSRVLWIMEGAHYGYRTPGSRLHWGEDVPGQAPKLVGTGNGSPCGIMCYEGDLFPGEYHGALLEADAGTRQINFFPLSRQGASFRTDYKVFLGSDDPWFRPVDMTAAPDGAVFVADWYDAGVGGHAFRDQTTGRIYRVVPKGKKTEPARPDFGTVKGLIAALRSPTVATYDAARRGLIEKAKADKESVLPALVELFTAGKAHERARALWVLAAITGDEAAKKALSDPDPRVREQAVRMLGRDARDNAVVEYQNPGAKLPLLAEKHLAALLPLAADPDAGVRRELTLALRNLPTAKVGEALKTLARTWDGQDRWALEALGLALEARDSDFIAGLFDGTLYGDLDLGNAGRDGQVALPPYFPADRNEAYIPTGSKELPANPLSKTLGLAWRLHRPESLPLIGRILPALEAPELQQAADDVLGQMRSAETAVVLADLAAKAEDPSRKRQLLATLARRLSTAWRGAQKRPEVVGLTVASLKDPELRLEAAALAGATEDPRYAPALKDLARDPKASDELKAVAVESVARVSGRSSREFINGLIDTTKGQKIATPASQAAVRVLPRVEDGNGLKSRLVEILKGNTYPAGLRREALRTLATIGGGATMVIQLARVGGVADDLKRDVATVLSTHPDRVVRDEAAKVAPLPNTRNGRPLPSFFELVRREGRADRGRDVFFRTAQNSCGGCHRVQGRGQWVGPDLSTIGTKYGRDELVRSILTPSAAIGYNFRSLIVALSDGRVITGLPVEDTPDRLVLKTADGQRIAVRPADVEERKSSDVSLMPEGLAETMTDAELIDLLTFLSTLKDPVSIVGQYQATGPVSEPNGTPSLDPSQKVDTSINLRGPEGQKLSWRRLDANAESLADLALVAGDDATKAAYLFVPVASPVAQQALFVLDTKADVKAWLNGKPLALPNSGDDATRSLTVDLPQGPSELLIRVAGSPAASIVTTFVAGKPLAFQAKGAKAAPR